MSIAEVPIPTRIGPESAGLMLTPAEFDAIDDYDDDYWYELVNGVLVVSPVPGLGERSPNQTLGRWLLNHRDDHPDGSHIDDTQQEQYITTSAGRRRADRVIWTGLGRIPDDTIDLPTIAIEFVSNTARDRRRDYVEKRAEYLAAGIEEYWVIDRFGRTLTVFYPNDTEQIVTETETYTTARLPGFELPLLRLLEIADRRQV